MSYLQLKTSDSFYYELIKEDKINEFKKLIKEDYLRDITKVIIMPTREEIEENLSAANVAFIAPEKLLDNDLLIVKNLTNTKDGGVKTSQQQLYNEDINTDLYNKFGIMVSNPTTKFNNLGGFDIPKSEMIKTKNFVKDGLVQKNLSIFLGVSRSGKSYFAECLAGELDYKLIILDLGIIMCSDNPSEKLDDFFYYLERIDNYVLLIDEIEKVIDPSGGAAMAKVLIGKLLTIFNNFNSESGFNIKDNFVIATANNILELLRKNPEFINRFGLKYFVNYPDKETFISVCDYYLKKMNVVGIDGSDIYNISSSMYAKDEISKMEVNTSKRYGKYASGEIKEFVGNLLLHCESDNTSSVPRLRADVNILSKVVNLQKPQIQFAKEGVNNTIAAAKIANFREVN